MFSSFEIETEAALRREEVARQVAAARRVDEAMRDRATTRAVRRQLATVLRVLAARLAPTTDETAVDAEPLVT